MRVACLSDTHEKHNLIDNFPEADIFIHAGDFTMIGEFDWVSNFNAWLGKLPYKHKLVIAGNHDRSFDIEEGWQYRQNAKAYGSEKLSNATYLLHDGIEIEGKKFWGSPYTPFFRSDYWKFHYDRAEAHEVWDPIPGGLDVLITHGPPKGTLDRTLEGDSAGCYDLYKAILALHYGGEEPRHHVFGHIHEGFGEKSFGNGTHFHNISAVDRLYRLRANPWTVFEI